MNIESRILTIGIIGSGTMGSGIAQVAATFGCQVKVFDTRHEALNKSRHNLENILARLIEKGRLTEEEKKSILSRIHYGSSMIDLEKCDLVIEAIVEDIEVETTSL